MSTEWLKLRQKSFHLLMPSSFVEVVNRHDDYCGDGLELFLCFVIKTVCLAGHTGCFEVFSVNILYRCRIDVIDDIKCVSCPGPLGESSNDQTRVLVDVISL